jgi:dihydrofolate synthase / folylpolyglutamate synthase
LTYPEAEAFLLELPRFADQGAAALKPGLERIEALLDAMGRPHERFESVHVAGTNGKGSTASMLAAIGTAAGLRVGLHTSPHLHTVRERMRIGGVPVPEAWLAEAVARYREVVATIEPSFFEATVALSFLYFAEAGVDLAVVEVGLGGRLDATNVLTPRLAIVTQIAWDHADLLGDTLEAIAREKAGIAKPGVALLTAAEGAGVRAALRAETEARGGHHIQVQDEVALALRQSDADGLVLDLETPVRRYERLQVGLAGGHQAWNAALAVRAAECVIDVVATTPEPVEAGLRQVRVLAGLAGRCEVLRRDPLVVVDVAHNADGLRAALATVWDLTPGGHVYLLLGVMRDKEPEALAALVAETGAVVLPVPLPSERALPADELFRLLRAHGVNARPPQSVHSFLSWFEGHAGPSDALLATGSHLTAAAVREALEAA